MDKSARVYKCLKAFRIIFTFALIDIMKVKSTIPSLRSARSAPHEKLIHAESRATFGALAESRTTFGALNLALVYNNIPRART